MTEVVLTFNRFKVDKDFKPYGMPEYYKVGGIRAEDINALVRQMRDINEMDKYTPWNFDHVDYVGGI